MNLEQELKKAEAELEAVKLRLESLRKEVKGKDKIEFQAFGAYSATTSTLNMARLILYFRQNDCVVLGDSLHLGGVVRSLESVNDTYSNFKLLDRGYTSVELEKLAEKLRDGL